MFAPGEEEIAEEIVAEMRAPQWTFRQKKFVLDYLKHHNVSRAWRTSTGDPDALIGPGRGYDVLELPHVKEFIKAFEERELKRLAIEPHRVLNEFAKVAFFSLGEITETNEAGDTRIDLNLAGEAQFAALAEIKVTERAAGEREVAVKAHSKLGALEALAKHLKLLGADTQVNVAFDIAERLTEAKRRIREKGK